MWDPHPAGTNVRSKIFTPVMKWQSPNFIKAKCSDPSTIVRSSFYFWKAFLVLMLTDFVKGYYNPKMHGPFAPSSGQVLNCNRIMWPLIKFSFVTTQNPVNGFIFNREGEIFGKTNLPTSFTK